MKTRTKNKRTSKATDFFGGKISGETRLGIAIRMLSGAFYLDLHMVYDVDTGDLHTSFNTVIKWINDTLKMPFVTVLMNEDHTFFQHLSNEFCVDSDEKFVGCI